MNLRTICQACLLMLSSVIGAQDRQLTISRHFSTADGLSCNQVFDMKQDSDGYIWLATANGLCRYDGYQFHNFYSLGTSGMHAPVGFIMPDSNGRHLWMQTSTYVFACYDTNEGKFVDYTGKGKDNDTFRKYLTDEKGVLWLFDNESGVRRVKAKADGNISCIDYTKEQGTMPNNQVNDAAMDNQGRLWVMTQGGLVMIDAEGKPRTISTETGYRKGQIINNQLITLTTNNEVMMFDAQGKLKKRTKTTETVPIITGGFEWCGQWVITTRRGVFCVDTKDCRLYYSTLLDISQGLVMQHFGDNHFVSDPSGKMWILTSKGEVRKYNLMEGVTSTVERSRRYNIEKGKDGLYYIASHGNGLFVYNLETDRMQHYSATEEHPLIGSNYLNNMLIDNSGCIWLGEELTGLSCILPSSGMHASYYYPQPGRQGNWSNYVRMLQTGADGRVTLSTRDNRLYEFNTKTGAMTLLKEMGATAYVRHKDSHGREWTGTRGNGLYIDGKPIEFPTQNVYDIAEDSKGRFWIATWGEGLIRATLKADGTLEYQQLMKKSYNESLLRRVDIGTDGRLWIASNNGIYSLDLKKDKISDEDIECSNMDNGLLPFNEVICMICTKDGHIWAGSRGGGLFCSKPEGGKIKIEKTFTIKDGMPSYNAYSMVEDLNGNVWVGTDNGISCINKGMKVSNYLFGQTVQNNIYSENCAVRLADGQLLFGSLHGLMLLTPQENDNKQSAASPVPQITSISINGNSMYLSTHTKELTVDYDQNSLVLSYSCLDFANLNSTQYQYYMEGIDRDWLPLTSEHQAHYNGLPPGKYHFKVRALGKSGQWGDETVFDITIRQPWYNTWWAWLIYLFIFGTLATYIYKFWRRNFELDQQIKVEKELSTFRLNFFTHIAHEFRTPLAIISGAAEKLTTNNEQTVSRSAIQTVRRGTLRLSKLVNQLMEFRRINTGNQRLGVMEADLVKLGRTTSDEFREMASQREQALTFTPFAHNHQMVFDPHLVETILYNLLSNAIKYTPKGGSISLKIKKDDEANKILLIVEDSGPGISEKQIPQLYQPFMHGYVSQGGMGIGLYTAYQSAMLHKGSLTYERISAEGGSRFTVTIPATEDAYTAEDYAGETAINTSMTENNAPEAIKDLVPEAYNDYTVAIIEDDPDMMDQIRGSIGRYFRTTGYTDGQSALSGIKANQPSIILCDIMLPDINGYEIVRQLRADKETQPVPIIMLTALDGDDHLLRGYKAGADDYMVKPCNFELLVLRITQLIKWYGKVKPAEGVTTVAHQQPIITDEADQRFREKMENMIAQHLGDQNFNVDTLAAMLKMGRTKFYGKMKEFTGMSPNNYLQTERLKKAAELLIEGELNVTEISYKVGFQSPTYFYKCFKEKYGVPPSKYGKQK